EAGLHDLLALGGARFDELAADMPTVTATRRAHNGQPEAQLGAAARRAKGQLELIADLQLGRGGQAQSARAQVADDGAEGDWLERGPAQLQRRRWSHVDGVADGAPPL